MAAKVKTPTRSGKAKAKAGAKVPAKPTKPTKSTQQLKPSTPATSMTLTKQRLLRRPAATAHDDGRSERLVGKTPDPASRPVALAAADFPVEPDKPEFPLPAAKASPTLVRQLAGHGLVARGGAVVPFPIRAVCALPGGRILTGGDDGSARIWQAATGEQLASIPSCHASAVLAAIAFADGHRVLTTGSDGTASVWNIDVESGTVGSQLARLEGHNTAVVGGDVYPGGERAITMGRDGSCRIWDLRTERLIAPLAGEGKTVVAVFPDGEHVAVAGETGRAEIWSSREGKLTCEVGDHVGPVRALAVFPDGNRVLTAGEDGRIAVWDVTTGERLFATGAQRDEQGTALSPLLCAALSPDGRRILAGDAAGRARLLEASDGREILSWLPLGRLGTERPQAAWEAGPVHALAFFPDDASLSVAAGDGGARVWRLP